MKEEYNFEEYIVRGSGYKFCGVTIRPRYIVFTKSFAEILKSDEIKISIDKVRRALLITEANKDEKGYKLVIKNGNSRIVSSPLWHTMPVGRYELLEKTPNGYILS